MAERNAAVRDIDIGVVGAPGRRSNMGLESSPRKTVVGIRMGTSRRWDERRGTVVGTIDRIMALLRL
jgi:hypothetical protein